MYKLYSELGEQYLNSKDTLDSLQNENGKLEQQLADLEVDLKNMNQQYDEEMKNTHQKLDIEIKPVKNEFEELK